MDPAVMVVGIDGCCWHSEESRGKGFDCLGFWETMESDGSQWSFLD